MVWVGLSNPHFVLSMGSQGKWSTARITEILKSYDKLGILPRNNPFYEGDTNWRANNLNYEYTYDEILEKTKIETNILYFAEKYASVMTDDGITLVKLRNYQKKILNQFKAFKNNVYMASRQTGKCVTFDTNIEIYDKNENTHKKIPIFKFHYQNKRYSNVFDKIEYLLFLALYEFKKCRNPKSFFGFLFYHSITFLLDIIFFFNRQLYKYDLAKHEILESSIPKTDFFVKGVENKMPFIGASHIRKKSKVIQIKTENGKTLYCADEHLLATNFGYCKHAGDLKKNDKIITKSGYSRISEITKLGIPEIMFDITVADQYPLYYTNDILSHNSIVSGIFIVWYILTNKERNILCTSENKDKVEELMDKIKVILKNLPFFLKPGIVVNNVMKMTFDNDVKLVAQPTTENTGASFTIHLLYCDEFALINPNFIREFFRTIFPTLSSSAISKMIITSTPRGLNKFYEIYKAAVEGKNSFNPIRVDWYDVEGRDEKWKQAQITDLGSEDDFNQEFGNQFLAGNALVFQAQHLKKLKANQVKFVHRKLDEFEDNDIEYENFIWHPNFDLDNLRNEACQYVISIDLADGNGGDYNVINIFQILPMSATEIEKVTIFTEEKDFFKLVQIGIFADNNASIDEILPKIFYHLVVDVMIQDNIRVILEMNHEGNYFRQLAASLYSEGNLLESEQLFVKFKYNMEDEKSRATRVGLIQNEKTKEYGLKKIKDKIKNSQIILVEYFTVEESISISRNKKGKLQSQTGNDDRFMSYVNVIHYYNTTDFVEQIDELLEVVPKEFLELVNKKLQKKELGNTRIEDDWDVY